MNGEWILIHPERGRKQTFQQNPRGRSGNAYTEMDRPPPNFHRRGSEPFALTLLPGPGCPDLNPSTGSEKSCEWGCRIWISGLKDGQYIRIPRLLVVEF